MIWRTAKYAGQAILFGLIAAIAMFILWLIMVSIRGNTVGNARSDRSEALARNQFWTALALDQRVPDRDTENLREAMETIVHSSNPPAKLLGMPIGPNQWSHANSRLGGIVIDYATDSNGYATNYGALSAKFALKTLQAKPKTYKSLLGPVPGLKTQGNLSWGNLWLSVILAEAALALVVFCGMMYEDVADAVEERQRQRRAKKKDVAYLASLGPRERRLVLASREIDKLADSAEKKAALKKVTEGLKIVRGESTVESDARLTDINRDLDEIVQESKTWQDTYRRLSS